MPSCRPQNTHLSLCQSFPVSVSASLSACPSASLPSVSVLFFLSGFVCECLCLCLSVPVFPPTCLPESFVCSGLLPLTASSAAEDSWLGAACVAAQRTPSHTCSNQDSCPRPLHSHRIATRKQLTRAGRPVRRQAAGQRRTESKRKASRRVQLLARIRWPRALTPADASACLRRYPGPRPARWITPFFASAVFHGSKLGTALARRTTEPFTPLECRARAKVSRQLRRWARGILTVGSEILLALPRTCDDRWCLFGVVSKQVCFVSRELCSAFFWFVQVPLARWLCTCMPVLTMQRGREVPGTRTRTTEQLCRSQRLHSRPHDVHRANGVMDSNDPTGCQHALIM